MADRDAHQPTGGRRPSGMRRFVHRLRTTHSGPERDPIAVGVGVFIGCTPLYGLHLLLSVIAADLLRLNRLKVYLAANISNPFLLPFLVFGEVQTGAWLRRGAFHALTRDAIAAIDPWSFGLDLVIGSLALGTALALVLGGLTHLALRNPSADPGFSALVHRAAERYAATSFTAWEFANAKLRSDPVYRAALADGLLPGGGTLVDIGCGQGLMLALLVEARHDSRAATGPAPRIWPVYDRLVGIDTRPRVAFLAAEALTGPAMEPEAEIITADARGQALPRADAVLLFDVLHMMPLESQDALLAEIKDALRPGGVVLVREADATAGWRFTLVRIGNRVKALVARRWRQPLAFRSPDAWVACFEDAGFYVRVLPGPARHPFGNTLFRLSIERG